MFATKSTQELYNILGELQSKDAYIEKLKEKIALYKRQNILIQKDVQAIGGEIREIERIIKMVEAEINDRTYDTKMT